MATNGPRVCIATINTGSFDFTGVGTNADTARQALVEGWMEHVNQYRNVQDLDPDLMKNLIIDGEVNFLFIRLGQCARDGSVISV